jgi:hypothetical protein
MADFSTWLRGAREAGQQIARRVVLRVADNRGAAAVGLHDRAFGHALDGVIGPFAVDVGSQPGEQVADRVVVEDHDVVDAPQCLHQLRS